MKKINIILLAIFISLIALLPAWGKGGLKPVTKFDAINSVISCKVDIAPLKITAINGEKIVKSPNCYQSTQVGKPELPVRSFFILLPPNANVKDVTITQIDQIELAGEYTIKLVSPPIPISKKHPPQSKAKALHATNDEAIYPEKILEVNSIQRLRGYTLACISAFAASYNPKTKQLIWNKQINFKLHLATSKTKTISTTFRGLREDEELVKEIVVNPQLLTTYPRRLKSTVGNTYKYVVITCENLVEAFKPLCASKSMSATIATTSWIYNHHQGVDKQEKIRNFIKTYYKPWGIDYVLLGGDTEIVPARGVYAKVPTKGGYEIDSNIPCDLYYACLDGNWNVDGDNIYGELEDKINLMPEVWIGRAPVNNYEEAVNFVNKVITTQFSSDDYIYNVLLIASILDDEGNDGKEIMEEVANQIPGTYTFHKEYESDGKGYKKSVTACLNSGVGFVAHVGHSYHDALELRLNADTLGINDVKNLTNGTKTFIFNSMGCSPGAFDESDCIGEEMILNTKGGAVAFIGNSREGWYEEGEPKKYSGEYQIEFFKKFFKEGYTRIGEALGKSKIDFISRSTEDYKDYNPYRWIMFCLNLLGDPAMEFRAEKEIFYIDHTIDKAIDGPGKVVDLIVTLKNLKDGTITGVSGTLSTTDQYISVVKGTATFGDIPPKNTATNSNNPYKIMVSPNCPFVHKVDFLLMISGDGGYKNIDKFWVKINLKVETLNNVIHYPNPCYPDEGNILKIANIPLNSNPKVYIYNLAGELIRTLDEEGTEIKKYPGSEEVWWNAKNDSGEDVAFGVYIYVLKCNIGTKKGKIAIIR